MSHSAPSSDRAAAPVVLAIETSTEIGSVALVQDGMTLADAHHRGGPELSAWVLPAIERLLRAHRLARPDAVACGIGPGAFTGVRTACATAQALAWGWAVPLHPVGSLEAFLRAHLRLAPADSIGPSAGRWAVLMDARQGETYAAIWDVAGGDSTVTLRPVVAPTLVRDPILADWLAAQGVTQALGSACPKLLQEVAPVGPQQGGHGTVTFLSAGGFDRVLVSAATGVADAAVAHPTNVDPLALVPHYVRDRVAFTEAERAAARDASSDRGSAASAS